ncbi:jg5790 [Pararge aegeria aegeria]|uniref:Jg5790 protein n=1 Tax=Pararge aegeria aegeria TaxID=348720 RepID=A0A8S4R1Q3_9NEOP|nr:jg5790 [Pararge aegeria aegeria]
MLADVRIPDYSALIRSRVAAFWFRILNSKNGILGVCSEYPENPIALRRLRKCVLYDLDYSILTDNKTHVGIGDLVFALRTRCKGFGLLNLLSRTYNLCTVFNEKDEVPDFLRDPENV